MSNHKEAELDGGEVRARVSQRVFDAISEMAHQRGEQVPVLLREALAEYIAARAHSGPPLQRKHILDVLRDRPKILQALLELAESVTANPVPSSPPHSVESALEASTKALIESMPAPGVVPTKIQKRRRVRASARQSEK